jgi:hypothetical protein
VLPSKGNAYTYCTLHILILHSISLLQKGLDKKIHMFFEDNEQTKLHGPATHGISKPPCVIILVA